MRQRLFNVNVFASLHRRPCGHKVGMVRRDYTDSVDVVSHFVEHDSEIGKAFGAHMFFRVELGVEIVILPHAADDFFKPAVEQRVTSASGIERIEPHNDGFPTGAINNIDFGAGINVLQGDATPNEFKQKAFRPGFTPDGWIFLLGFRVACALAPSTSLDNAVSQPEPKSGARGERKEARQQAKRRILPPLPRPTTLSVNVDGVERSAIVFPGIRSNAVPSPVLLWFHGYGGRSVEEAERRRLHQLWPVATILYPQGLDTDNGRGEVKPGQSRV